jgi:predicted Rossmann fold nucleotide-binding protein DprA/Smf involved in DNA uptake
MSDEISRDTQATLLLCSRLGQNDDNASKPLSQKQYGALARWLLARSMRPADLLSKSGRQQLMELQDGGLERSAVESLLDRGAALGLMVERWSSRGLWVISRGDSSYPGSYKTYLGSAAPPLLFGAGNLELLQLGGLAVVGSRQAHDDDVAYARRVGCACAAQRIMVVSGGAKGIDLEAMSACVEAGGTSIGVLADSLARCAVSPRYRSGLISDRLVLVSACDPEARWFVHTAMERNKFIYGLSDAALVVTSVEGSGGTWTGATEALKLARIPVYVRDEDTAASGNRRLLERGAKPFPPEPWDNFRPLLERVNNGAILSSAIVEPSGQAAASEQLESTASAELQASDAYMIVLPSLLAALAKPNTEKTVEESLGLVPAQAKAWLKRACDEGRVRKLGRPVRYVAVDTSELLFGIVHGVRNDSAEVHS